jgi:hypothetical protein
VSTLSRKNLALAVFAAGWLAAAGWGLWRLADYSFAPGPQGSVPSDWPASASTARNPAGFTLVLALHPECPCSRATLEELDSIIATSPGLQVRALFVELAGVEPADQSELWAKAGRMAGVQRIKDPAGGEAARFGALTSGETRLYGPSGRLLFRGGITAARGHVGDNPGHQAILALLTKPLPATLPVATPVFGCELGIGDASTP